eukprot:CAMPEP_0185454834 /NCGR_PEP_ID=MMETSP1365-20130426/73749_1 /TAXON_ID=38817 /ORGANISM="Gephyrocapsa oceanica, Strain RCC1303" /LENGTH=154 /DNA_ID=CAMNT_0028061177 /DNA_START=59 /DNA_END=519 /DNA_ORIENTATION=-
MAIAARAGVVAHLPARATRVWRPRVRLRPARAAYAGRLALLLDGRALEGERRQPQPPAQCPVVRMHFSTAAVLASELTHQDHVAQQLLNVDERVVVGLADPAVSGRGGRGMAKPSQGFSRDCGGLAVLRVEGEEKVPPLLLLLLQQRAGLSGER